ncbi:hypothetical protein V491_03494 [Pseudogymnoascus sp. VKM F-3775]|nr:hypothetical protein V491_03494 [Pseudogymnoascus sp. VKM F-3775]
MLGCVTKVYVFRPNSPGALPTIIVGGVSWNRSIQPDICSSGLWQQNSPIAPYSDGSDDESPSELGDADESNHSDGSAGSNFIPAAPISQKNRNITDFLSPTEEDTVIESIENPQQEDTIIRPVEIPQQEDNTIGPIEQETIPEPIENSRQEGSIIESIEVPESSPTLESLQISASNIQTEERNSPLHPHPINLESQIDQVMADTALPPEAESLSDASSHTLGRELPSPSPGASPEGPPSDNEVTDRCYGFLLLHYPKTLPAALDSISVLLIYQRRPHGLHPYWGFPKGHPEPEDHSDWESASRELLEETGLDPERVKPITPSGFSPALPDSVAGLRPDFMSVISQYPSFDGGIKEVTYFLARVTEMEKLTEQVEELVECRWVKLSEARQLVDTKPVRRVLEKLIGLVSSGPNEVIAKSDWIRWKEVDALNDDGTPRQWRTVGFCTPE